MLGGYTTAHKGDRRAPERVERREFRGCRLRAEYKHKRWIASIVGGVRVARLGHGSIVTRHEACNSVRVMGLRLAVPGSRVGLACPSSSRANAQALALRVVAERLEHEEAGTEVLTITFRAA